MADYSWDAINVVGPTSYSDWWAQQLPEDRQRWGSNYSVPLDELQAALGQDPTYKVPLYSGGWYDASLYERPTYPGYGLGATGIVSPTSGDPVQINRIMADPDGSLTVLRKAVLTDSPSGNEFATYKVDPSGQWTRATDWTAAPKQGAWYSGLTDALSDPTLWGLAGAVFGGGALADSLIGAPAASASGAAGAGSLGADYSLAGMGAQFGTGSSVYGTGSGLALASDAGALPYLTGTGAGLALAPGAGTAAADALGYGAGIGGSLIGSSVPVTPAGATSAANIASGGGTAVALTGTGSSTGSNWFSDIAKTIGLSPQMLAALLGGATGLLGNSDSGYAPAQAGPPKQWTGEMQKGLLTTPTQYNPPALLPTGNPNSGAWRFMR